MNRYTFEDVSFLSRYKAVVNLSLYLETQLEIKSIELVAMGFICFVF